VRSFTSALSSSSSSSSSSCSSPDTILCTDQQQRRAVPTHQAPAAGYLGGGLSRILKKEGRIRSYEATLPVESKGLREASVYSFAYLMAKVASYLAHILNGTYKAETAVEFAIV